MESHVALPSPTSHKRKGSYHRKRMSTGRLSSESIPSLPEYTSNSSPWRPVSDASLASIWDTDGGEGGDGGDDDMEPPRYSAPARSAIASTSTDEDADHEGGDKRGSSLKKRHMRHRRSYSFNVSNSSDNYLDALLERSVKALEISNSLLQSSITPTHTGLTSVSEADPFVDQSLETYAPVLSRRIGESNLQDTRLDEMFRGILGSDEGLSQSLPVETGKHMERLRLNHDSRPRRQKYPSSSSSQLQLSTADEPQPAAPPRCLTQYVSISSNAGNTAESTSDTSHILMPSTLGLRGTSQLTGFAQTPPPSAGLQSPVQPILTDRPIEPSTPAITLLSTLVARAASSRSASPAPSSPSIHSPHHSATSSWSAGIRRNRSQTLESVGESEGERTSRSLFRNPASAAGGLFAQAKSHLLSSHLLSPPKSPTTSSNPGHTIRRSRSMTPTMEQSKMKASRPPPLKLAALEPESPPRPDSKGPEDAPNTGERQPVNAFRTMESLRRILEDTAPLSEVAAGKRPAAGERPLVPRRAPAFYPVTPQRTTVADLTTTVLSSPPSIPGPSTSTHRSTLSSSSTTNTSGTIPDPTALEEAILGGMPSPTTHGKQSSSLKPPSSSNSTPPTSGRSTPRVSFSALPPKHHASPTHREHRKARVPLDKNGKGKSRVVDPDPGDATLATKPSWLASWWDSSSWTNETHDRVRLVREERGGARLGSFDM